ncbi:MAG: ribbon-helix-helix protein, CopG family [Gammaproteobacteria bacterium]|nr:ribbon-helix-helix protein, CopG family [Gammaproteobacteria bacterium]
MKTAISVPDDVFAAADRLARRLGVSRSELYATAVAKYVAQNRAAGVRERLDAIYEADPEVSALDPVLATLQTASLQKDDW